MWPERKRSAFEKGVDERLKRPYFEKIPDAAFRGDPDFTQRRLER